MTGQWKLLVIEIKPCHLNQNIIKPTDYIEKLRTNHEAEGVLQKLEKMARLLELGGKEGNVDDIVAAMISEIESK